MADFSGISNALGRVGEIQASGGSRLSGLGTALKLLLQIGLQRGEEERKFSREKQLLGMQQVQRLDEMELEKLNRQVEQVRGQEFDIKKMGIEEGRAKELKRYETELEKPYKRTFEQEKELEALKNPPKSLITTSQMRNLGILNQARKNVGLGEITPEEYMMGYGGRYDYQMTDNPKNVYDYGFSGLSPEEEETANRFIMEKKRGKKSGGISLFPKDETVIIEDTKGEQRQMKRSEAIRRGYIK